MSNIGPVVETVKKVNNPLWALGLMSGTSLDGIDIALIKTDGVSVMSRGPCFTTPYSSELRILISNVLGGQGRTDIAEKKITLAHACAVKNFLTNQLKGKIKPKVIGFHGHTILHLPQEGKTWQIGDGQLLADMTGIPVVGDLRKNDVKHGGQGAPVVPLYHAAIFRDHKKPFAVLNIGGVANVTWIGEGDKNLIAFDTGPGGAQLDEWIERETGDKFDNYGNIAKSGCADNEIVNKLMCDPYFSAPPPKSLDRIKFSIQPYLRLTTVDGAATLAEFTSRSISVATQFFPEQVRGWLVTGGGRKNKFIMERLAEMLGTPVLPIENLGFNGDSLEAEAFAYLATRSIYKMPITLPKTTGVDRPRTGGKLFKPK